MSEHRKSNVEFITDLMESSRHGPIMQAVVITALQVYSDIVLENPEELKKEMKNSFISGDTWVKCCQELSDSIKNREAT
jgi:hypothetical protein